MTCLLKIICEYVVKHILCCLKNSGMYLFGVFIF